MSQEQVFMIFLMYSVYIWLICIITTVSQLLLVFIGKFLPLRCRFVIFMDLKVIPFI
jgi:hypothetical protein